jgi:hypothetical protein
MPVLFRIVAVALLPQQGVYFSNGRTLLERREVRYMDKLREPNYTIEQNSALASASGANLLCWIQQDISCGGLTSFSNHTFTP